MEKCIIKAHRRPDRAGVIRIDPSIYKRIVGICDKTGNSITAVATTLLTFGLDHVEIEYVYREDPDGVDCADSTADASGAEPPVTMEPAN